jgi:hypothetical protein
MNAEHFYNKAGESRIKAEHLLEAGAVSLAAVETLRASLYGDHAKQIREQHELV